VRVVIEGVNLPGRRGERFVDLSWGTVGADGAFTMFRRAKLMLPAVDPAVLAEARRPGSSLVGRLSLTGGDGGPRCGGAPARHRLVGGVRTETCGAWLGGWGWGPRLHRDEPPGEEP